MKCFFPELKQLTRFQKILCGTTGGLGACALLAATPWMFSYLERLPRPSITEKKDSLISGKTYQSVERWIVTPPSESSTSLLFSRISASLAATLLMGRGLYLTWYDYPRVVKRWTNWIAESQTCCQLTRRGATIPPMLLFVCGYNAVVFYGIYAAGKFAGSNGVEWYYRETKKSSSSENEKK
jgi:hypothetical protein